MSTIFPHPVLHNSTLDYDDPQSYRATFRRKNETVVEVQHHLKKNTLVASMIKEGTASFYCTVSVRGTTFRRTEATAGNCESEYVTALQEIKIPVFRRGYEICAQAGVVNRDEETSISWDEAKALGVDDFHEADYLKFSNRALLAHSGWVRFFPMDALFRIKSENVAVGEFRSVTSYPNSTIRITIYMAPKLFDEVQSNPDSPARSHILCASLVQTLKELQELCEKQNDEELDETESMRLEAAKGLKNYFQTNKIPVWGEEGFNPVEAASKFKPAEPGLGADALEVE